MTLTELAKKHDRAIEIHACGGCGETDPDKRCLNCLHDFYAESPLIAEIEGHNKYAGDE